MSLSYFYMATYLEHVLLIALYHHLQLPLQKHHHCPMGLVRHVDVVIRAKAGAARLPS
jgi:hypothetical protein